MQDLGNDEIFKGCTLCFLISGGATLATTEILCPFNDNDSGCDHKGEDEDAVGGSRGVATQLHTHLVQSRVLSGNHLTLSMFTVTNALWSHISKFV